MDKLDYPALRPRLGGFLVVWSVIWSISDLCSVTVGKDSAAVEAALVNVRSDGRQQAVPLKSGKFVIGRQEDCQLRIPSAQISRHHCEITAGGAGIRIRDLGSSNGTFVNGQKIDDTDLAAGDVIAVGSMLFVVQIDGDPVNIDPEELGQRVRSAASAAAQAPEAAISALADSDDSSIDFDFAFDMSDDDDDQPAL